MIRFLLRASSPTSRFWLVIDGIWVLSFSVTLLLMSLDSLFGSAGLTGGMDLQLRPGIQRQGLYREGKRVGSVISQIQQAEKGWELSSDFSLGDHQVAGLRLQLRQDLSLAGFQVRAGLQQLQRLSRTSLSLSLLEGQGDLELRGTCAIETGACQVQGTLGKQRVELSLNVGRGPVLESAIYPLLVHGRLGNEVEVSLFNGLSLEQRPTQLRIIGREKVRLHSGEYKAIRVHQQQGAFQSQIWLDEQGMVLIEELPLGLVLEHETWSER